ncbi:hypothetical protein Tco_1179109 [Tanacetum coccineum]
MNYQPMRSENQANKHAGPKEANHSVGLLTSNSQKHKAKNAGEEPNKHPDFKPIDKEDQVFLDELERLKSKHEAYDVQQKLLERSCPRY